MMDYQSENQFANDMLKRCLHELSEAPMETMLN